LPACACGSLHAAARIAHAALIGAFRACHCSGVYAICGKFSSHHTRCLRGFFLNRQTAGYLNIASITRQIARIGGFGRFGGFGGIRGFSSIGSSSSAGGFGGFGNIGSIGAFGYIGSIGGFGYIGSIGAFGNIGSSGGLLDGCRNSGRSCGGAVVIGAGRRFCRIATANGFACRWGSLAARRSARFADIVGVCLPLRRLSPAAAIAAPNGH
jgi:hypothetical protein